MTIVQGTLHSERWLDIVTIRGSWATNEAGADSDHSLLLPAGLGDVAIMEGMLAAVSLATPQVDATLLAQGVALYINTTTSTPRAQDVVGVYEWRKTFSTQMQCYFSPDPLVLWRQDEALQFTSSEVDVHATPTGDFILLVKCVRVRDVQQSAGPIRLVR